jgi:hypothetical protein
VALAAVLTLPLAAAAQASIRVVVDKSAQQMTVAVDGVTRYVWPVSTGRPGYDTPNGSFKPNRMDADHLSQEWDNAPMPHAIFFDLHGHAIHGFFDTKHLGLPVSHGCVRIAPEHAALLYALVTQQGMKETSVVVSGQTPARGAPEVARRRPPGEPAPVEQASAPPLQIVPAYGSENGDRHDDQYGAGDYVPQPPRPYGAPAIPPPADRPPSDPARAARAAARIAPPPEAKPVPTQPYPQRSIGGYAVPPQPPPPDPVRQLFGGPPTPGYNQQPYGQPQIYVLRPAAPY